MEWQTRGPQVQLWKRGSKKLHKTTGRDSVLANCDAGTAVCRVINMRLLCFVRFCNKSEHIQTCFLVFLAHVYANQPLAENNRCMETTMFRPVDRPFYLFCPVLRLHSALITFKLGQMDFNDIKSPHCSKKKESERKKANKLIQDVQLGGQLHADWPHLITADPWMITHGWEQLYVILCSTAREGARGNGPNDELCEKCRHWFWESVKLWINTRHPTITILTHTHALFSHLHLNKCGMPCGQPGSLRFKPTDHHLSLNPRLGLVVLAV